MKILEERCGIITNMEAMLLLVQQQQLLPSVDSLLRCASKPSSSSSGNIVSTASSKSEIRDGGDLDDTAGGQNESAAERFRLDHVKELLYQHMFNQMVQDYIRKTCPYLHLVRAPSDSRHILDRSKSQQAVRNPTRRSLGCAAGSRRASGIAAIRHGGAPPLISRRCRECLDALVHRFGLTELELLTILNLGAYKPVEIYMFLEDCSSRFTEEDAAAMLNLIDLALVQQQALPPQPESGTAAAMDIEQQGDLQNPDGAAPSELEALRQQQEELQEEARQLELQQQQVQHEAAQTAGWPHDRRIASSGHEPAKQEGAAPADDHAESASSVDLFPPPNEPRRPTDETGSAIELVRETKPRGKPGRTATAKRRAPSRRKRVLDD